VKNPVFLLISLLLIAVPANLLKVSLLLPSLVLTAISLTLLTAMADALRRPLIIVCELTPCSTWSLISFKISPASTTTDVVPSPTSASCDLAISVRIRAAGCTISRSCILSATAPQQALEHPFTFITVAPSFVIVCLPFSSTSNKSPPYGPSVLRIVAWTAKQALIFETI
jgi:hypothetical protein